MNILHTESSRNFGGQEVRILEEIEWFQSRGHKVWLAAAENSGIHKALPGGKVPFVPVLFCGSYNLRVIIGLIRFCRLNSIELIITHGSRDTSNAGIAAKLMRIPIIRYQHVCKPLKDDFFHKLIWKYELNRVVAVSESIKQRLIAQKLAKPETIEVIGEYVDTEKVDRTISPGDVRLRHGIPKDAPLILQIGMIRPDKGQKILVLAADEILRDHPDCRFMFVGSPTEERFLDELMSVVRGIQHPERIIFAGFQKNLAPYIAASDIVCLTSLIEAQSKVIPQAFAMRKLVVAPDVGGIPELVRHNVNGLLYEKASSRSLAQTIHAAFMCDCESLIAKAHELLPRLDIHRVMRRTERLYEKVIA
jgi:glycosyltransferase involved in cell wall biosynthesis